MWLFLGYHKILPSFPEKNKTKHMFLFITGLPQEPRGTIFESAHIKPEAQSFQIKPHCFHLILL